MAGMHDERVRKRLFMRPETFQAGIGMLPKRGSFGFKEEYLADSTPPHHKRTRFLRKCDVFKTAGFVHRTEQLCALLALRAKSYHASQQLIQVFCGLLTKKNKHS
jgi:hypothetical protein